jgi:glycosyltransferase involved in cell wall biosynthesis
LLNKAKGDIEIIAILDGWWENPEKIIIDSRVNYLHFTEARGMRNAINSGVAIARGQYIMKCDAHCMFSEGFDETLKKDCQDNWVLVPRRYALDPEVWGIEDRTDRKYPIDMMYLSETLQGVPWNEGNDPNLQIQDLPISQGSCWFMNRDLYYKLGLLDEEKWGLFYWEFLEISLKAWSQGAEIKVDRNTWYAHFHKVDGRGYSLPKVERERAEQIIKDMSKEISIIREKFPNMP